jgi:ABC-2 type transport system permease protein
MWRAAITKDLQLLLRDRGALISLFALPLVFMGAFGSMFSGSGGADRPRPIAVHAPAGDAVAERITSALDQTGLFALRPAADPAEVRRLVVDETVDAGLIVPPGLDPAAGRRVELVMDPAVSLQVRGPLEGALRAIVDAAYYQDAARPPAIVVAAPEGLRPPGVTINGFQVSVPGNAVLFGFFMALTVGLSFVEERRTGTWRRLLAAPVRRPVLLLAKLVPYYLVSLVQMAVLFGIGVLVFDLQIAGSLLALVVLTLAVAFCATTLGLLIASFGGSEKQIGAVGSVVILVMGLLGGAMVPRMIMPDSMQALGLVTPHAWALDGYYDVLIREGTGLAEIAVPIVGVLGFGVAFAVAGSLLFRFERR